MLVMGMVAVSCAPRRDELDGSGTVSGRINNPGKLTFSFPAKTVVAVYPMRNCCACPLPSLCFPLNNVRLGRITLEECTLAISTQMALFGIGNIRTKLPDCHLFASIYFGLMHNLDGWNVCD
jgi:hypothetical protein